MKRLTGRTRIEKIMDFDRFKEECEMYGVKISEKSWKSYDGKEDYKMIGFSLRGLYTAYIEVNGKIRRTCVSVNKIDNIF